MEQKSLDNLRDCVKEAFNNGCERGEEFLKMRHAIIAELFRLKFEQSEVKDKLLEWNKRCEKPLGQSEQVRQLLGYVDWFSKRTCRVGCNALRDFCVGKEKCQFYIKTTRHQRETTQELPFDFQELKTFLTERFKGEGYIMTLVITTLRRYQCEKATGVVIIIGLRKITSLIRDHFNHNLGPMTIHRAIKLLVEEGVIEVVVKGKKGNYSMQANGYSFLPWKPPSQNNL